MKKYKNQVEENEQFRIARNDRERATSTRERPTRGAVLSEIEPGSIAEELGLEPGATITQINEQPLRDAIQLKMADVSEKVSLTGHSAQRRGANLRHRKRHLRAAGPALGCRTLRRRDALPEQVPVLLCRSVAAAFS
jgi:hypothetical protein